MTASLHARLLGSFLAVIATCGAVTIAIGLWTIDDGIVARAQAKLRIDANVARWAYRWQVQRVQDGVARTAESRALGRSLAAGALGEVAAELAAVRRREQLDLLTLADQAGRVVLRSRARSAPGAVPVGSRVVARALATGETVAGTDVLSRAELLEEGEDLAARARVPVLPTQHAQPTDRTEVTSGLLVMAASPVRGPDGGLAGVLYGGRLLNRLDVFVDQARDTVFQGEVYGGKPAGTATLFLGDVRVATNVLDDRGQRAVGTRVAAEVGRRVLGRGEPWYERAFVVNDWYLTTYEPLRDVTGAVVGMLYVGLLEQRFVDLRARMAVSFALVSAGGVLAAFLVCWLLAGVVTRPVLALEEAAARLAAGDLARRVEPDGATVEIGALGRAFNEMAASLQRQHEELVRRTQEEVQRAERLAMVGQLAAGVAHEINNPLGGILLFANLLLKDAPPAGEVREGLERIAREAQRCQRVVQGLLDFARRREPHKELLDLNGLLDATVGLVAGQPAFLNVAVERAFDPALPRVLADGPQLQQVFLNVMVNAVDAMGGQGSLRLSTRRCPVPQAWVEVSVADSGPGIAEADLPRVFEPFFTTKEPGRGTGLGLSISHGIVSAHGGRLSVQSRPGEGATFVIGLPAEE